LIDRVGLEVSGLLLEPLFHHSLDIFIQPKSVAFFFSFLSFFFFFLLFGGGMGEGS
jgi:hypothetical protein